MHSWRVESGRPFVIIQDGFNLDAKVVGACLTLAIQEKCLITELLYIVLDDDFLQGVHCRISNILSLILCMTDEPVRGT